MTDSRDEGENLADRLRQTFRRPKNERPDTNVVEPCAGCGDETAVGSYLFPERHDFQLPDERRAYLCAECHAKARAALGGRQLTEQDIRVIADNGFMIGASFFQGGF